MFKPTLSGLTCLSSPTTRICFARKSAGRADKVDLYASSTMTKSLIPSSAGRDSDTRLCGIIQQGSALLTASAAFRAVFRSSEDHSSELQSLMRLSSAVSSLKKKKQENITLR